MLILLVPYPLPQRTRAKTLNLCGKVLPRLYKLITGVLPPLTHLDTLGCHLTLALQLILQVLIVLTKLAAALLGE